MNYEIYFDESGDLGWSLETSKRGFGSSRYFTIAFIAVPNGKKKYITRFLRKFHRDRGGKFKEVKATALHKRKTEAIARAMRELFNRHSDIVVGSITIDKRNFSGKIREKGNKHVLYNYLANHWLANVVDRFESAAIIPDKQSVPAGSLNSGLDLLKTEVWIKKGSMVDLSYEPTESHLEAGLMFVDWVANFIWRSYEYEHHGAYQILKANLIEHSPE